VIPASDLHAGHVIAQGVGVSTRPRMSMRRVLHVELVRIRGVEWVHARVVEVDGPDRPFSLYYPPGGQVEIYPAPRPRPVPVWSHR
jgi:hypothetical protein